MNLSAFEHSRTFNCDGKMKYQGNQMYGCECGRALISAPGATMSALEVVQEIKAVNKVMNNKSLSLADSSHQIRKIMTKQC